MILFIESSNYWNIHSDFFLLCVHFNKQFGIYIRKYMCNFRFFLTRLQCVIDIWFLWALVRRISNLPLYFLFTSKYHRQTIYCLVNIYHDNWSVKIRIDITGYTHIKILTYHWLPGNVNIVIITNFISQSTQFFFVIPHRVWQVHQIV